MTDAALDPRPLPTDDPVEAATDLRPVVAKREGRSGVALIVAGAVLLGVVTFALLLSGREDRSPETTALTAPAPGATAPATAVLPPPDLTLTAPVLQPANTLPGPTFTPPPYIPPAPAYSPPPPYGPPGPPPPPPGAAGPTPAQRRAAPTLIVDLGAPANAAQGATGATGAAGPPGAAGAAGAPGAPGASGPAAAALAAGVASGALDPQEAASALTGLSGEEQFAARVSGAGEPPARARATMLRNPSLTVPQGALIPGVLETALNSDLPGFARAVVSRDVRSFDGSQVLIPRGSRVIGEYKSGVAQGQSRAFIIWSRVIRPDGASIQIASNGTDDLGRAGLTGQVDRKFLQRFGGAILTTVLQAGVAAVSQQPSTSISIGGAGGAAGVAGVAQPANISPTIKVPQGSPIRIFVGRDLDFSPVGGAR